MLIMEVKMSKKLKSDLLLILTAFIWGSSFIAQSKGADLLGPFTFNAVRYFLAVISLAPVAWFLNNKNNWKHFGESEEERKESKKALLIGGIVLGSVLFIATSLQQYGMAYTTAAKGGFITTLYVIFVPILGIFFRKKVRLLVWFCAILAVVGLYLLSIKPGTFTLTKGDTLVLLCAVFFTIHILFIDHFSPKTDGVFLSCMQFLVVAIISTVGMFAFETFTAEAIWLAVPSLLYTGIGSSSIGYTLQIVAQKDADPTITSLILSLESVFAAVSGALFLGEFLNMREITGCVIMFVAIILAQLPEKNKQI